MWANGIDFQLQVQTDLQFIKEDISAVERHRLDLYRARDRYSLKLRMLGDDSSARKSRSSSIDNIHGGMSTANFQTRKVDGRGQVSSAGLHRKDGVSGSDQQNVNQSGLAVVRKKRVHAQVCHFTSFHVKMSFNAC